MKTIARRPVARGRTVLLGLFATAALVATGLAQEPQAEERAVRQDLEERLEAARELPAVEGSSKRATLIQSYSAALTSLDAAAQWRQRVEDLLAAADTAPERSAALQARLDAGAQPLPALEGLAVEELERREIAARSERDRARAELDRLEAEQLGAPDRQREIADLRAELEPRIERLDETLRAGSLDAEDSELASARLAQARAQRSAAVAHAEALRVEDQTYQLRTDVIALAVRVARRDFAGSEATLEAVKVALLRERLVVTQQERAAAEESRLEALEGGPAFSDAAEHTLELRERSVSIARELEVIADELASRRDQLAGVARRFEETRRRVDIVGLSNPISLLLRQEQAELIRQRALGFNARDVRSELTATQVELLDRALELDILEDRRTWTGGLVDAARAEGRSEPEALVLADDLYEDRVEALRANREILEARFDRLLELDVAGRGLAEELEEYEEYLEERILWIRSAPPVWRVPAQAYAEQLRAAASPEGWSGVASALRRELSQHPVASYGTIAIVLLLLGFRRRARAALRREGELAVQRYQVSISPTLRALLWTAFLTVGYAAPLVALGAILRSSFVDEPLVSALGLSCQRAIAAALILGVLRSLTLPGGLGEAHFDWPERGLAMVRRLSTSLLPIVPTAALAGDFLVNADPSAGSNSLSRLFFIVESGSILFFIERLLHPSRGVIALGMSSSGSKEILFRLRRVWYVVGVGGSAALLALAIVGYGFTARSLLGRLEFTFGFVVALVVFRAVTLRWITLARRREALERRRRRREDERQKRLAEIERRRSAGESVEELESEGLEVEEETPDFAAISQDVRDLVRLLTGFAAIAGVFALWTPVLPALGFFDTVNLWQREVSVTDYVTGADGLERPTTKQFVEWVSLADLGLVALLLLFTWVAVRNVTAVLELVLFRRFELGSGERYAIATLVKYLLTIVGTVVAFQALGVSWGKLQWLVAGVSVGLGFGLQEIFANFVSGITLLFERPVRVGDWVTLGEIEGVVSKIRIRATTIRDRDLKELIVPNREFITGQFINWTLSDPVSRVMVTVGIAYGSDTELAIKRLLEAGRASPHAVEDPPPNVVFRGFGDSALDFELRIFVSGRETYPRVVHDLHVRIDAAFRESEIEIAFPQRDLHIRSAPGLEGARRLGDAGPSQADPPQRK